MDCWATRRQWRFDIGLSDNGIGIRRADLARVLEPFQQVATSLTRSHEGTGLGLPITKSLVELHGGQLEIDSTIGMGTTVTLKFPPERSIRAPAAMAR
ncbi:MAG: hypothetical protein FJX52_01870 [Alphaproteobacteria bacterium]|nr:hypothetical protein [Alphaproteobacteria bacterium]